MTPHAEQPENEVFLKPGETWFGGGRTRVRTLLGSCVAITLWHPSRHIGGMCHYMLGDRPAGRSAELDGRYAEDAMAILHRGMLRHGSLPAEYQAKLFGGGRMFDIPAPKGESRGVQDRNIEVADQLMKKYGITVAARHTGGDGHRTLLFDVWSGHVWMRHTRPEAMGTPASEGVRP
jgi:chemotaxis protein CheD